MKKLLLSFLSFFACCLALMAQTEITWSAASDWETLENGVSYTSGDYTILADKGENTSSKPMVAAANDFRTYAKNTFTVTSSKANITKIVFYISSNGKKRWADVTPDTGTTTVDKATYTTTWEGDAKKITFTVGDAATYGTESSKAGQFCIDKLVIYTAGESGGGESGGGEGEGGQTPDPEENHHALLRNVRHEPRRIYH